MKKKPHPIDVVKFPSLCPSPALFRKKLLAWYHLHGRHDLPWRGSFNPYAILVSEFMLQQTTVATVRPYFHRFLTSFPTVERLAQAPLERVLKQWSGLGYYARARNLHRAAQQLVRDHQGQIPPHRSEAEALPGVGPYTAGALLSFAYNQPEALVDGNVIRVLSRIFGVRDDTRCPRGLKKMWALARRLVGSMGARHYNSALMDFGATVCKPGLPDCSACPLRCLCWAHRHGAVGRLPVLPRGTAKRVVSLRAFLLEKDGRVGLRRRPLGGLWGGLWELPMEEATADSLAEVSGQRLARVRHVLSHRDLRVELWRASPAAFDRLKWVTPATARTLAISNLTRKLLHAWGRRPPGSTDFTERS